MEEWLHVGELSQIECKDFDAELAIQETIVITLVITIYYCQSLLWGLL